MSGSLHKFLNDGSAFQGYAYAYPHKTAYRRLDRPVSLRELWAGEERNSLFLYAHVPFCEMRCGFCNLFTTANPESNLVNRYLDALERQAEAVASCLTPNGNVARLAVGGGTPTFLELPELERLFAIVGNHVHGVESGIPKAIEVSPGTLNGEKVAFFLERRVTRVSLGVQSFVEAETGALGRPQKPAEVRRALALLTGVGFPCVNLDLIYGSPGQTCLSWKFSLEAALECSPQEIYLYPLYVRPLTGLARIGREPLDGRLELYRAGRDFLLSREYKQVSMRLFRSADYSPPEGPVYCCQEDGMVGLGPGARSYTSALHYSTEYAVGRGGVKTIIDDFTTRSQDRFFLADYGCWLNEEEQQRRYVIKSLLRADGLDVAAYRTRFRSDPYEDLPQLAELAEENLARCDDDHLRLNSRGLELSDVIGPWLASAVMRRQMESYALD